MANVTSVKSRNFLEPQGIDDNFSVYNRYSCNFKLYANMEDRMEYTYGIILDITITICSAGNECWKYFHDQSELMAMEMH